MMRSFLFIASWILAVTSQGANVGSWKSGNSCEKHYCLDKKGHFNQRSSFVVGGYLSYRSYKLLYSFLPTNFVVYFRNIKNPSQHKNFLQICDGRKCDYFNSVQDQLFVFRNVKQVTIVASSPSTQFEVQYYAGCNVLDQRDVDVHLDTENNFTKRGRCWVIIPRLYEGVTHTQYTAASNIVFSNVNLPQNAALSISNVLTGEVLMNFDSSTNFEFSVVEKDENKTPYQLQKSVSSVFLLTVDKCPSKLCAGVSFKMDVQAMNEQDVQCFWDHQACELGITEIEEVNCDNLEMCSSYNNLQVMANTLDVGTGLELDGVAERVYQSGRDLLKKCNKLFRITKFKKALCGEVVSCQKFGQCKIYCQIERSLSVYGFCGKKKNRQSYTLYT